MLILTLALLFLSTCCAQDGSAPSETANELPTEATDPPAGVDTEAPVEQPTEAPTDPPTEAPADPPTEAPADPPTEAPTDPPTEAPADPPTEAPTDPPTDAPADPPTEAPTDPPTEAPAEPLTEAAVESTTESSDTSETALPVQPRIDPAAEAPTETTPTTTTAPTTTVSRETLRTQAPQSVLSGANEQCTFFRPGPTDNTFQQFHMGIWFNYTCFTNLIWDQSTCRCEYPPFTPEDPICGTYRPVEGDPFAFQRHFNGAWQDRLFFCPGNQLWNQATCRCDVNPNPNAVPPARASQCNPMFYASFDEEIKDDSPHRQGVGREPWESISVAKNVAGANGGGAARVINGQLVLWFTGANDFGSQYQFQIRFRLSQSTPADQETVILQNRGCAGGLQTFSMSYRPSDQLYRVFLLLTGGENGGSTIVECNMASGDPYGFHEFAFTSVNKEVTITVDGQVCGTPTQLSHPLRPSACYMGIGGFNFNGYIDDSSFRKVCVDQTLLGE